MKFGNNVDLDYNQLLNPLLHNLSSQPTGVQNARKGLMYFDTGSILKPRYWDGQVWRTIIDDRVGGITNAMLEHHSITIAGQSVNLGGTLQASAIADAITSAATKLGTTTVGASNRPIYLNEGVPTLVGFTLAQACTLGIGTVAENNGGAVTGGNVYNYITNNVASNTELAASNNAIAENRARIDDIESLLSAPNFATAYIGELGVEGINLGGVDIWSEGDVALVGGSFMARDSTSPDAFVKAEYGTEQIGIVANNSVRGLWNLTKWTENETLQSESGYIVAASGHGESKKTWLNWGNVGIGNFSASSPSYKLHVSGTFGATDAATLSSTLSVGSTATIGGYINLTGTKKIYFGGTDTNDPFLEFVNIAASGQPPLYALHTNLPFYSDSWIASGGVGSSSGGGGGGYNAVIWDNIRSGTGPGLSSEDNSYLPTAFALLQTYVIANNAYNYITAQNGLAARVSNLETSRATTTYVDDAVGGLWNDLIESNKIKTSLLPDFIMGQMLYGGTVTGYASSTALTISPSTNAKRFLEAKKGLSANELDGKIVRITSGSYSKSGNTYSFPANDCEGLYFLVESSVYETGRDYRDWQGLELRVGDWVVATSGSTANGKWEKVDNTDAVVSVNNKTGAVTITKDDVGLGAVENAPLSTWTGTQNITTLGTITTGVWHGSQIADAYISSATSWNGAVQLANELDAKMDALQVALPNAIAENRSRIDDIGAWMVKPNAAEAYVGELGTMGINLGGVDIWNAGEEVNIGGALRVDQASSFNSYINLVGTSKKIYFGGTGTNDPFLEFVNIAASGQPALYALHTNLPFYSDSWIASGGIGSSSGGGGGIVSAIYTEYTQTPAQNSVYSASFVNGIYNKVNAHDSSLSSLTTRVTELESGSATIHTYPVTGNTTEYTTTYDFTTDNLVSSLYDSDNKLMITDMQIVRRQSDGKYAVKLNFSKNTPTGTSAYRLVVHGL